MRRRPGVRSPASRPPDCSGWAEPARRAACAGHAKQHPAGTVGPQIQEATASGLGQERIQVLSFRRSEDYEHT